MKPITTTATLPCERCNKATKHSFSHYETTESTFAMRIKELIYRCVCGKSRKWGMEQEWT